MEYQAECSCGQVKVSIRLPQPIEEYQARECDCDFCVRYGLAYISDANGTISFAPIQSMNQLKQGSGQATFWQCSHCTDFVAVTHDCNGVERGAVVKALFANKHKLKPSITVSPRQLQPKEKPIRWSAVWSRVVLE
ncbi:aldehyde-activating protein [Reinekea sp. G2M2-21]|uniref:aldehyde-activating protein n=1 Tax=Reinekea sp. G2M2-21 TaxID=2788942 RepID=UPI0018AB1986|nr:aldehyde-activating protein [Reinekea sp. G2M2-21]